jgi:hypothetical protein
VWKKLWALPQAIEWERMQCEDIVALYVRAFCAASEGEPDTKMLAEVRQLDAKIGLSPKAMRDLRWETDVQEVVEVPDTPVTNGKPPRAYVPRTGS